MSPYETPGVYRREVVRRPRPGLQTGVPAFVGVAERTGAGDPHEPLVLTSPEALTDLLRPRAGGYLERAVAGFFENGGRTCFVAPVADDSERALRAALERLEAEEELDLVCAPDVMHHYRAQLELLLELPGADRDEILAEQRTAVRGKQLLLLDHCRRLGNRFAILDALPEVDAAQVLDQRAGLEGADGALYYPWIQLRDGEMVPPCGHVAGVYARSDEAGGVHKAPANETVRGALDLDREIDDAIQARLNPQSVNCIRALPGRGIRVWGARTLSRESAWTYVSVRRIFLTAARWIDRNMHALTFEPNDLKLWARIERELSVYFESLFHRGALRGATPQEAFYIKCDVETNPPDVRELGQSITEIGLAPGIPSEFVVVQLVHDASGTRIAGPTTPG